MISLLGKKPQRCHKNTSRSNTWASQVELVVKNPPANEDTRDTGSILGLGRFLGGRHGNPLQYPCLENSMDRGVWQATAHGATKSWTRLSTQRCRLKNDYKKSHAFLHTNNEQPKWKLRKQLILQ